MEILERFPQVYFICGEVDPFVDDTVIMAGRIREAKLACAQRRESTGLSMLSEKTGEGSSQKRNEAVEICLVRGISHGFLQMRAFLPEARNGIARCRTWLHEILEDDLHSVISKTSPAFYSNESYVKQDRSPHNNEGIVGAAPVAFEDEDDNLDDDAPLTMGQASSSRKLKNKVEDISASRNDKSHISSSLSQSPPTQSVLQRPSTGLIKRVDWENKNLMGQEELLSNRVGAITRHVVESLTNSEEVNDLG